MSTTTTSIAQPTLHARLSATGDRIILRGYSPELLDFFHSLPEPRFSKADGVRSCLLTPMAAYRIGAMRWCRVTADSKLQAAINGATMAVLESRRTKDGGVALQPQVRKLDGWKHQVAAYHFSKPMDSVLLAMGMGCGKSKVAIDLIQNWQCQTTLILCPKSVLSVWRGQFDAHAALPFAVLILEGGSVAVKQKAAEKYLDHFVGLRKSQAVLVLNYESAWREPFANWAIRQHWGCVILDESHRCKSHNSAISKFVAKLGRRAWRRLCLTGTPMPHDPLDLFGQYRFLDPGVFGTSWFHFRNRYALMANPHVPQQITGYRNQDELKQRMALMAYRVGAEVLDLPPVQHHVRTCLLSTAGKKHYDELENELITEIKGGMVTAANTLVKSLRLRQATSGFLVDDDTKHVELIDTAKRDLLAELLEDIGPDEPAVVFCQFHNDLDTVAEVARSLGRRAGELSGRRKDLTDHGTMPPDIDVLAVQIQSGGLGVDLTRAAYAFYFNHPWSLGDYDQSMARVHRPGQTRPTHYYHLVCEGTVDTRVQKVLEEKRNVVESILEILREANHG